MTLTEARAQLAARGVKPEQYKHLKPDQIIAMAQGKTITKAAAT
jgi:hypothetical protein